MRDNSGNGKSKVQVVTAAAAAAMTLVPDDWALGLWTFSPHDPPKTDWTELVPLGPVKTQRRMLTGAVATLPTRVPGNTGLYDTVLAAFQDVSAHYDLHLTRFGGHLILAESRRKGSRHGTSIEVSG
jgi:hypothetical protein